jgi:hypothetical protein
MTESTLPESPDTLEAQLQWLVDDKRAAVLITPGAVLPDLPIGIELMATEIGVFVFNPDRINPRLIRAAINDNEVGLLLGYGVPNKPERPTSTITIRSAAGREKQSVMVDGATRAAAFQAANVLTASRRQSDDSADKMSAARSAGKMPAAQDTVTEEPIGSTLADRLQDLTQRSLRIYPVKTQAQVDAVQAAASADNHSLTATHYITRNGEILGAVGLSRLPVARIWLHSEKVKAADSLEVVRVLAGAMSMAGDTLLAVIINRHSPFYKVKERFGFIGHPDDTVAIKVL